MKAAEGTTVVQVQRAIVKHAAAAAAAAPSIGEVSDAGRLEVPCLHLGLLGEADSGRLLSSGPAIPRGRWQALPWRHPSMAWVVAVVEEAWISSPLVVEVGVAVELAEVEPSLSRCRGGAPNGPPVIPPTMCSQQLDGSTDV